MGDGPSADGTGAQQFVPAGEVVASCGMKTRTLLLLSLGCALAIAAAGIALAIRVATAPEAAPPAPLDAPVVVGGMTTVVRTAEAISGLTVVEVAIGGVVDTDASSDFVLLVAGTAHRVEESDCDPSPVEQMSCRLAFRAPVDPGTSVVLTQTRGDQQERWVLVVE